MKLMERGFVALVCMTIALSGMAGDWPQWRGPERTGVSRETGLLKEWPAGGPAELWAIDTPGEGYAAPAVVGDTIYITGSAGDKEDRQGILYALSAKDGSVKWERKYGAEWGESFPMSRTTPSVEDGSVYVYSGKGIAGSFDAATGEPKWSVDTFEKFGGRNIKWGVAESPLIVDNKFICHPGGTDAAVAALNKANGETVWTTRGLGEKSAYCSPFAVEAGGLQLILTQTEADIVGINAGNGAVVWKVPQKNKWSVHPNTPVVFDDKIFISSGYGYGSHLLKLAADGSAADVVWKQEALDSQFHGVLYAKDRLFGSAHSSCLMALDPEDGRVVYQVKEVRQAAIVYADGCIYGYDEKGGGVSLVEVETDTYKIKGSFKMTKGNGQHWAHPVVANGVLYIRHGKALVAYDVKATRS